jgi:endonuclease/exonuclease/phosphatase family metal-dependent hydrolase
LTRDPLRFVTWNVQKCEGGRDEVIAELKKLDADVICLQEVIEPREGADSPHQTREIAAALSLDWYSQGGRLDDERDQCLAILCRAPLRGTQSLSTVPERNYAIAATTQWKGRPLRIVCVHLAGTYKLGREHVARTSRARAKDWEALLREAHQWREATVLAGDFNTFPGATQFELLTDMLPFAGDPGPTFPSRSPALRLDHVLSTPDLAVLSILCVDTQVSDHRPVSVEFTLKSRPDPKDPGPASQTQTQAVRGTAPERN